MNLFFNSLLAKTKFLAETILTHFQDSHVSVGFFVFIFLVFILDIIKQIMIWKEKKDRSHDLTCKFLINSDEQDCSLSKFNNYFKDNLNSCEGCPGKTIEMTNKDAEELMTKGSLIKKILVFLANFSKNILPYLSFLYTLCVVVFKNN